MNPLITWYIYCRCSNAEFCKQLELSQGMWLICWSSMHGWSRVLGQSDHYYLFLRHYYIIITCCDGNNGSVITYLYIIITSLLHISTPVIRSLFLIISCYYSNNGPIITVIMDPILLIITRSIIGNNESYDFLLLTQSCLICQPATALLRTSFLVIYNEPIMGKKYHSSAKLPWQSDYEIFSKFTKLQRQERPKRHNKLQDLAIFWQCIVLGSWRLGRMLMHLFLGIAAV